jgi:hypothetical protein
MPVLGEQIKELPRDVLVLLVHEGQGVSHIAHATGSADAMYVVVDVVGQIVVDDLRHVGNVETAGSDVRRHQHGTLTCDSRQSV